MSQPNYAAAYAISDMASNKTTMSLRVDEGRAEAIRQVMQLAGENTKAGAIDTALHHYIRDHRNKKRIVEDLDPDTAEKLSTPELPIEVEISTAVGLEKGS